MKQTVSGLLSTLQTSTLHQSESSVSSRELEHRTPGRKAWVPKIPSEYTRRNFSELNRTVTSMVLKAKVNRTGVHLAPCHDKFRGPPSDYGRPVALETTTATNTKRTKQSGIA
ncbi:hypothetical protein TNCV_42861 [Trichonephila clavipes]|nr:hypothetical protein TNCV_42861 [Trichonephila clavipes]